MGTYTVAAAADEVHALVGMQWRAANWFRADAFAGWRLLVHCACSWPAVVAGLVTMRRLQNSVEISILENS